ncbi:AraC-like ligand binding domain protein [Aspergillus sclerotialis]|uniref:AraC-like ligand binding domain protein n=1 Tax=Aspergillus sclerotialis TaxID=2070753 RepID=A0A3A2ZSM5_9EURO|nr:AraC-like ligand binding domain protein [Aspergillus sclerotialis]
MSADTRSQPSVRPFVLSKQQIDSLPFENFAGDKKKATGGWRNIFSSPASPTDSLTLGIATFPPRSASEESFEALHRHKQAEFYYILSGHAVVKIEGLDYEVTSGHALFIPGDAEHGFWNTSNEEDLIFLWGFGIDGFGEVVYRFSHE